MQLRFSNRIRFVLRTFPSCRLAMLPSPAMPRTENQGPPTWPTTGAWDQAARTDLRKRDFRNSKKYSKCATQIVPCQKGFVTCPIRIRFWTMTCGIDAARRAASIPHSPNTQGGPEVPQNQIFRWGGSCGWPTGSGLWRWLGTELRTKRIWENESGWFSVYGEPALHTGWLPRRTHQRPIGAGARLSRILFQKRTCTRTAPPSRQTQ